MSMSNLLQDKVVLVTGGAGGLGKAIVQACLENNAKGVVLADINETLAKGIEAEFKASSSSLASTTLDVSLESSCASAVQFAIKHFGRLDVLINNAAIMDAYHSAATCEKEMWDRVIGIDLTGPYLMTKYAVKHFLGREDGLPSSGSIVNIGSIAAQRGTLAGVAYTTAKHGLIGLTKNTAAAHAKQGIRASIVLPGGMKTNMTAAPPKDYSEEGLAMSMKTLDLPVELFVDVQDMANTIVFLASDSGRGMNGAVVTVDNGINAF
ncbi:bacilysin biosynthesis oxidoreductase bacC [Roridomyces roridus]|uniref:Bacilysin biosynthesis oxidoreductase bacC n=1 Tax=Roridomyces roridus TaxID=1738132 RepID=A0AAD7BG17_9AGAR|nr:bacilysin biosynthesis oxidoreductase bacC [Roridomyces roridus]